MYLGTYIVSANLAAKEPGTSDLLGLQCTNRPMQQAAAITNTSSANWHQGPMEDISTMHLEDQQKLGNCNKSRSSTPIDQGAKGSNGP